MNNLFRTLNPREEKSASYFLTLHFIRVKFSLNNYNCEFHFNHMDRVDAQELSQLPKAWHIEYSFFKGRFFMYMNDFARARIELHKALSLAHKEQ